MSDPSFINLNFGNQRSNLWGSYVGTPPTSAAEPPQFYYSAPRQNGKKSWQDKLRDEWESAAQRVVQEIPESAVDCGWILVDRIIFTTDELDALLETGSLEALLREAYSLKLAWTFTGRDSFEARELHFKTPVPSITTLEKRAS